MMNDHTTRGLGYDPCDQTSFPYQADDPPFNYDSLMLDPISLEAAPELQVMEYLTEIVGPNFQSRDPNSAYRTLDMALRLFVKLTKDSAFEGIDYPSLLAASLDTAFIWELG